MSFFFLVGKLKKAFFNKTFKKNIVSNIFKLILNLFEVNALQGRHEGGKYTLVLIFIFAIQETTVESPTKKKDQPSKHARMKGTYMHAQRILPIQPKPMKVVEPNRVVLR